MHTYSHLQTVYSCIQKKNLSATGARVTANVVGKGMSQGATGIVRLRNSIWHKWKRIPKQRSDDEQEP